MVQQHAFVSDAVELVEAPWACEDGTVVVVEQVEVVSEYPEVVALVYWECAF